MDEAKARSAARMKARKDASFKEFQGDPMTRLTMAQIPGGDHQEALDVLLQTAFTRGFLAGQANIAEDLLDTLTKTKRRRRPDYDDGDEE